MGIPWVVLILCSWLVNICDGKQLKVDNLHGMIPSGGTVVGGVADGQIELSRIDVYATLDPSSCTTTSAQEVIVMIDGDPFPIIVVDGVERVSTSPTGDYAGSVPIAFVNPGSCTVRLSAVIIEYHSLPWYKQSLYWVIISVSVVFVCVTIALLYQYSKNMKRKHEYENQTDIEAPVKDSYPSGSEIVQYNSPSMWQQEQQQQHQHQHQHSSQPDAISPIANKRHTLPANLNVQPYPPLPPIDRSSKSVLPPSRKKDSPSMEPQPQQPVSVPSDGSLPPTDVPKGSFRNNYQLMSQKLPPAVESPQGDSPVKGRGRRRSAPHGSAIPQGRRWSQPTFSAPLTGEQRRQLLEQAEKRCSKDFSVTT